MCMFDKMFEEGGHKFRKRSPKQAATVTNSKITISYNPSKDLIERNFFEGVKNWRSIPPTGYQWKSIQQQAEQVEEEKPFSYLAIVSTDTHDDQNQSMSQYRRDKKRRKKIKKERRERKHSKHKKQKKEKKKRREKQRKDKQKKNKQRKDKKKKHHKSRHKTQ